ncbi:hypothetical protein [Hymenobacter properus]|uniref:Lipoprotein n=1 Tax=Hymenobacter properus TaxID=2791026 RepID=A0A931BL89_9BACT|nr:hypothetical protein [Hymenobacter properus]MBF9142308.1 hypothetical protein [Hymenobacter properus]MBR7721115.1 hypothetical protein [Microvirga sp. SRT04]
MKLSSRPALALLLGTALAATLTSCDYRWSPGENMQFRHGFTNAPGWHNSDVNRDSINYKQEVHTPIGVGSAIGIKNGTVQDQLNSAPAGKSTATPQDASGQLGNADQSTNGNGNQNDAPQPK